MSVRDTAGSPPARPGPWRTLFLLALPAVLLMILMGGYAAAVMAITGAPPEEAAIRRALPIAIFVNHLTVFAVLIVMLRAEGRTPADIGWGGEMRVRFMIGQVFVAVAAALILYLFKEVVFDSLKALLAGREPTFNSLFRFNDLDPDEYGILLVAVFLVFIEESVYRGYAIPNLAAKWGPVAAVAVSAFFFGLLHVGNGLSAFVFTAAAGVIYSLIFLSLARRRLWGLSAGHGLYNALILMT